MGPAEYTGQGIDVKPSPHGPDSIREGLIMAKLKTAILRAQETAEITGSNESLLWQARAALSDAINNPEPDEGLTSAERALHLINTYLLESELCKR